MHLTKECQNIVRQVCLGELSFQMLNDFLHGLLAVAMTQDGGARGIQFHDAFRQQEQILFYIADRLPRFKCGALDATGNGAALAEYAANRYGALRIEQVKLNDQFYLENMAKFKAALQDETLRDLPRDREIRDDLRSLRVIDGIPKLPKAKTHRADGEKLSRHGDAAISLFLAHYAGRRETVPMEFDSLGTVRPGAQLDDYRAGQRYSLADFMI